MNTQLMTFLIVGVLVGAAVGVTVGYLVFNDNGPSDETGGDTDQTYWFYIDFENVSGDKPDSAWITADAADPVAGLIAALKAAELWDDSGVSSTGWISSIGGIENEDWDPLTGSDGNWMSWFWSASGMNATAEAWRDNPGFNVCIGTVFYLGYTAAQYNVDAYENFILMKDMNPNDGVVWNEDWSEILSMPKWSEGGPFAA